MKSALADRANPGPLERIGKFSVDQFLEAVRAFHGYAAPGVVLGGIMVHLAQKNLPEGELFDAISETDHCLPDAIQLLTPCTYGNGWLKVFPFGRWALALYEKTGGAGVRVFVDTEKIRGFNEMRAWFFKEKRKKDQDSGLLLQEILACGHEACGLSRVRVRPRDLGRKHSDKILVCPACGEAFRSKGEPLCRACAGESPYEGAGHLPPPSAPPSLVAVVASESAGMTAFHDMTRIEPGVFKGPEYRRGQVLSAEDARRLQNMGRGRVYVQEKNGLGPEWVHEDEAAIAFARAMAGPGAVVDGRISEGKAHVLAADSGLFMVDTALLKRFNMAPDVACASRRSFSLVEKGARLAAVRALPLMISRAAFDAALSALGQGPVFSVRPLVPARVGIISTGNEVHEGRVQDRFIPLIEKKVLARGCEVVARMTAPDKREEISGRIQDCIRAGAGLVVVTGGLSVDPDDVTRQAVADAGATDMLYGAPVFPGAMALLARLGPARVMGVPAGALYFARTVFDVLLPRVLAGLEITRPDLADLGHGGFCMECEACVYPRCAFGA